MIHAPSMTAALGLLAVAALAPAVGVAKPKPREVGDVYCFTRNDSRFGKSTVDWRRHRCCYWEKARRGEALQICVQCDTSWQHCTETPASRRARPYNRRRRRSGQTRAPR